jgi:uncharacterized protein (TIGR02444 family)
MNASVPDNPFWTFSIRLYAKPGVAPTCLALQERHGLDVNVLLYCAWLGAERGVRVDAEDVRGIVDSVRAWSADVVERLRVIRTAMKGDPRGAPQSFSDTLRNDIKRAELDAERIEQHILFTQNWSDAPRATRSTFIARENMQAYLKYLGIRPDSNDESQVGSILGGVDT